MQNDEAVRALLRLEEANSVLATSFVATFMVGFLMLLAALVLGFVAHVWRRFGSDGLDRTLAAVSAFVLAACVLALPSVVSFDVTERREALAALADGTLCDIVLRDVSHGDIKYMDRASALVVSEECGRERFLVAANSPRSVLSADAMGIR